ncbi:GNAT family N-acetyltransferase [Pediococcus siamensis]|uniref:GNAT family N-acetyltransferase n=1 Tax=Pediococcus siamensis TaxID=381829 RepID=UPI0039A081A3
MEKFEKYHPILTPHYTLDWLTAVNVIDIYNLRHNAENARLSARAVDTDVKQTADYVNRTMHAIMTNKALMWAILDRKTDKFLGTFCIWQFDENRTTATIKFEISPDQQNHGIMSEVLNRMVQFAFTELGLQTLLASTQPTNQAALTVLKNNGFQMSATTEKDTIKLKLTVSSREG